MGDINFYLREPGSANRTAIICKFNYGPYGKVKTIKFSVGESINPKHWDFSKKRPKQQVITNKKEHLRIKNKLNETENIISEYLTEQLKDGILPNKKSIKDYWQLKIGEILIQEENPKGFKEIFNEFVEETNRSLKLWAHKTNNDEFDDDVTIIALDIKFSDN